MANLDDLNHLSITSMSQDERLELLRQIRLSRRTPTKSAKTKTVRKPTPAAKAIATIDPEMAKKLLELLGGKK